MGVFLTTVVTKELDPLSLEHTTYWVYMLKYYGQLNTGLVRVQGRSIPLDGGQIGFVWLPARTMHPHVGPQHAW